MIDCGCCGGEHETVAEIRACCAERPAEATPDEAPPPDPWFDEDGPGPDEPDEVGVAPVVPDATAALGAPTELGRSVVVTPGATPPAAWVDAPRVAVDPTSPDRVAAAIDSLEPLWLGRTPYVVELAAELGPGDLAGEVDERPPWKVDPSFSFPLDRLAHLVWSNAIDLRRPEAPSFEPLTAATTAGAVPGAEADVVGPDGGALWCDGGPLDATLAATVPHSHAVALRHRRIAPLRDEEPTSELAPDQLAAVRHRGGPCRVISPAGSGKTRTLTERARHLVHGRGIPASAVCLVAYNKRAADEMTERLPDLDGLQIRTLNSLALAIVNGTGPFGEPRQPRERVTTMDEPEVRRILDSLVDFPRRANTDPAALWIEALAKIRLGLRDPDDVAEDYGGDLDELATVFEAFDAELGRRRVVDFDHQIYGAVTVLLRDPEARARARQACSLLLVDEFQDLTPAHLLLLRLLSAPRYDVFAVGDDDQTIYGYNGADPRWLIDFADFFPGAESHPLTVNYRCPPAVVASAGNLLSHNRHRVDKTIHARPGRDHDPGARSVVGADETVRATVETIAGLVGSGADPDDIVVLTRVNAGLAPVQVALGEAGLPVDRASGPDWLQRTGVRAALSWLALASSDGRLDAGALREAARRPTRGLSRTVGGWISEQRTVSDLRALAGRMRKERDRERIDAFADDVDAIGRVGASSAADALVHVRDVIGLGTSVNSLDRSRNWTNRASHGDDLDALIQLATLHDDPITFADWLRGRLAERPPAGARVQLHTVHRVKGLEWPHVVVHEASSRLFPHHLSDGREEERRIFHVALTRCSESVTVVAPTDEPSPFLAELDELLDPADLPDEPEPAPQRREASRSREGSRPRATGELADALRSWRMDLARSRDVPAYVVFTDRTLDDLLERRPASMAELSACHGIGPAKLADFGAELLAAVAAAEGREAPDVDAAPSPPSPHPSAEQGPRSPDGAPEGLADTLKAWRLERARTQDVPAYRIFNDKTLDELCARLPASEDELLDCPGIGPAKLEAFGDDLLALIADAMA